MMKNYDQSVEINHNPGKIYLYVKDPFESKDQLLINRGVKVGIKKLKNPKVFIDFPQAIDAVYKKFGRL